MYTWEEGVQIRMWVSTDARGGHQVPWSWNYRPLWASMWMLGLEFRSSVRRASALNHLAISPERPPHPILPC